MERSELNAASLVGVSVAKGFAIWAMNLVPFLVLTALCYAPLAAWAVVVAGGDPSTLDHRKRVARFLTYSPQVALLLSLLTAAAVTYGTVMTMRGQRPAMAACLAMGLRRVLPALGTLVMLALCFFGVSILIGLPVAAFARDLGVSGTIVVGLIALVFYTWILSVLFVATPVCAVERPGILAALGRSRVLTRGRRGAIALLVVMQGILWTVVGAIIRQAVTTPAELVYGWLAWCVLFGTISAVMTSVAYSLLREAHDGTSVDELAQVFG